MQFNTVVRQCNLIYIFIIIELIHVILSETCDRDSSRIGIWCDGKYTPASTNQIRSLTDTNFHEFTVIFLITEYLIDECSLPEINMWISTQEIEQIATVKQLRLYS